MGTKWRYGQLSVMTFSDFNMTGERTSTTVALLSDSTGTVLVASWKPGDNQHLYAAMDTLGADGWVIDSPSWVDFASQVELADRKVPEWIRAALQDFDQLPPKIIGYYKYPIKRRVE
jgi:hypothetical protein